MCSYTSGNEEEIHTVLVDGLVRFWVYCHVTRIADWFVCHCLKTFISFFHTPVALETIRQLLAHT